MSAFVRFAHIALLGSTRNTTFRIVYICTTKNLKSRIRKICGELAERAADIFARARRTAWHRSRTRNISLHLTLFLEFHESDFDFDKYRRRMLTFHRHPISLVNPKSISFDVSSFYFFSFSIQRHQRQMQLLRRRLRLHQVRFVLCFVLQFNTFFQKKVHHRLRATC